MIEQADRHYIMRGQKRNIYGNGKMYQLSSEDMSRAMMSCEPAKSLLAEEESLSCIPQQGSRTQKTCDDKPNHSSKVGQDLVNFVRMLLVEVFQCVKE